MLLGFGCKYVKSVQTPGPEPNAVLGLQIGQKTAFMKKLFFAFALLAVFSACKKTIDNLPENTQTGANTFGCKINGENWGPLKAGILPTAPILEASFGGANAVFINARNFSRTPTETEMEIFVTNITGPGTYDLNQNTDIFPSQTASYAYYVKRKFNIEDEWITSSAATGRVVITKFDVAARIVSGTFEFTANANYGSAPVTVTEGRFDVKLQ